MTQMTGRRRPVTDNPRAAKHDAITRAASDVFLAEGFDRASVDQIAHRAGVSKQTIYSHFADKRSLFKAICAELTEKLTVPLKTPPRNSSLRSVLIQLGESTMAMMLHPASLDLHRLVISASARFPELGAAAFEAGARHMIDELSALLVQRSQVGDGFARPLTSSEANVLAEQFMGMLHGFHQMRGLLGVKPFSAARRRAYVESCVDLLLRAA